MDKKSFSEQELVRRNALKQLRELGIDPYPAQEYEVTTTAFDIKDKYEEGKKVSIAGRIMSRRIMGKASFIELKDHSGRIQVYLTRDDISNDENKTLYNIVFKKLLDIGDIIGIRGFVFKTKVGETTVHAEELTVLSKSLRPLPIVKEKEGQIYDAFADVELRYRQRYVDLLVNDQIKDTFVKRTQLIDSLRRFLNQHNFLEVDTPVLQSIPGGAAARPFITHHNTLDISLYLRIANELYLKRLIIGGFDRVYEFSRNFRNEGMDKSHNPEFTILEFYVAYKDYNWMARFTEKMLEKAAMDVLGTTEITIDGNEISFKAPYKKISLLDSIKEHTGYDLHNKSEVDIRQIAEDLNLQIDNTMGKGKLIDEIFSECCEKHYIQPTFILDYPIEMSPLTKKHRSKEGLTERFELLINGREIANAYSELNDPIDQLERFKKQVKLSEKGDDEAMFIDHDFVRALEYGMPPNSGIGFGIDRLIMLLTGNSSIQEVIFFPQMRPEKRKQEDTVEDFKQLGVQEEWAEIVKTVFTSIQKLKNTKPTQIQQQLNGYRKKNKLTIPAIQLNEVEKWL